MRVGRGAALMIGVAAISSCARATVETGASSPAPSPSTSASPDADWATYDSAWEGITFRYPAGWTIEEASVDVGAAGEGESVRLTSSGGFTLTWNAPLDGIGGGCEPTAPHVFIDRVMPLDPIGSENPLSVIVARVEDRKTMAVIDATALSGEDVEVGDTGECLFYPIFESKQHRDIHLLQFITGTDVQIGNGAPTGDAGVGMTVEAYLAQPDAQTALAIFRSLTYP